ncbi:hypothetical protein AC65_5014 [Escherichia coli 2-005-03_S4_C1]|nr:hypothetical protein AC13_4089 [Escherichia coli 2-011-08_S3_C2]KDW69369.1 hypothetical protein AC65_5014 [Escherichia coli 2-005-03_S4_C1]KDY83609.1 hypothetical protein AB92_4996 [Escherichia coli 2-474-04_S3_C1]KDY85679.1 hypothetical protein AC21_5007 [Escherichia coli 2-474-04_S3_C2]KDZ09948.1 hypothetical protein AC50_5022 [Escherichia coli 2-474-04_S3_C3]
MLQTALALRLQNIHLTLKLRYCLNFLQTKGVTMVENGAFVSGDNPLLNNLSSVHFTMKKM